MLPSDQVQVNIHELNISFRHSINLQKTMSDFLHGAEETEICVMHPDVRPPPPPSPKKKNRYVIGSSDRDSCHFTNSKSKVEIKVLPFERPQCLSWNLGLKGWHGPVEVNKHQRENHEKIRWREELCKRWKWRAVEKLQEETGQKNKEFVKLQGLRLKMIEIWFDSHFHPGFLEAHELTRLASFHVFHGLHWEEWSLKWFRCAIYVSFLDSNLPTILHSPESFGESSLWPLVLRNKKNLLEAKRKTPSRLGRNNMYFIFCC